MVILIVEFDFRIDSTFKIFYWAQKLDFSKVNLPIEWFKDWIKQIGKA